LQSDQGKSRIEVFLEVYVDGSGFLEQFLTAKSIATVVLVVLLMGIRYGVARYIRRSRRGWTSQQRLRWIGASRIFFFIVALLGVIYLWGEAIQGFAVSVFAIAFAIVFSVKELCMCFNGSIVRFRGKFFEVGDRIQIGDIRGDVIETTLLSTTVQEVGTGGMRHMFTGRTISFANNLFLTERVVNESFLENFYLLHVKVPVYLSSDWEEAKKLLLKIAQEEAEPFLEQAKRSVRRMEGRLGLELPSVEPAVTVEVETPEIVMLHLKVASPSHLKERLEQLILNRYLEQQAPLLQHVLKASRERGSTV
jgi:small-conductance mechanosensitive channel